MSKANDKLSLLIYATRKKCFLCKHVLDGPIIHIMGGEFHISVHYLFHQYDTHGIDPEIAIDWILGRIYNLELTDYGYHKPLGGGLKAGRKDQQW